MASFTDLENFQNIFEREDYNYISNNKNIAEVSYIIRNIRYIEHSNIKKLIIYLNQLESFYDWIGYQSIKPLEDVYYPLRDLLIRVIDIIKDNKKEIVSSGYLRKIKKNFEYSLINFLRTIRIVFATPEYITVSNITSLQLRKFILDKVEGVGSLYSYNKMGVYSFVNTIARLNKIELAVTIRLLLRPSANQIRKINGWTDLGIKGTAVRILLKREFLGKDKIYFLYRLSDHDEYDKQYIIHPKKVLFKEL